MASPQSQNNQQNTKDCPILTKWRNTSIGILSREYIALANITPEEINSLFPAIDNREDPKEYQSAIGEKVYFLIGRALAAQRQWNRMTFLQLEYEARVQGFLGPYEEHELSEWRLRLMLEIEARQLDEEKKKAEENQAA
jgi:hypothetical protein